MARSTLSPRKPTTRGIGPIVTPVETVGSLTPAAEEPDLVRKFMRENPAGSLPDTPEESGDAVGEYTPDLTPPVVVPTPEEQISEDTPPPAEDAPAVEVPATPAAEPTPEAPVPATPATPAEPVAAAPEAPVAQPAAAVEAPRSYEPSEKIYLHESVEPWTREQIVAGLQERAQLQPKAQEADKFHSLFGFENYEKAEAEWKPVLEILKSDPGRTQILDSVLRADPGLLQYLSESAAYYNTLPADQRYPAQAAPAQAQAQPTSDPRMAQFDRTFRAMQKIAVDNRVKSEWQTVFNKYPYLQTDERARQALVARAGEMFQTDERNGKDPLEARGLLDAMNEQAVFLEAAGYAYGARMAANSPATAQVAAPAIGVPPANGTQGLLGSGGPTAGAPGRAPTKPKGFKGNPDQAVAAFLRDHPDN